MKHVRNVSHDEMWISHTVCDFLLLTVYDTICDFRYAPTSS